MEILIYIAKAGSNNFHGPAFHPDSILKHIIRKG